MKPAARPFGVMLLIAYVPQPIHPSTAEPAGARPKPQLFRLDPSGSISCLGSWAIVNGNDIDSPVVRQSLRDATKRGKPLAIEENPILQASSSSYESNQHNKIASIISNALRDHNRKQGPDDQFIVDGKPKYAAIVSAVLSSASGLTVRRHAIPSSPSTQQNRDYDYQS